jgi:hypothetical protein
MQPITRKQYDDITQAGANIHDSACCLEEISEWAYNNGLPMLSESLQQVAQKVGAAYDDLTTIQLPLPA